MATLMEVLKLRLLSSFDGIEKEADVKVQEIWDALAGMPGNEDGPFIDETEAAELAEEVGHEH